MAALSASTPANVRWPLPSPRAAAAADVVVLADDGGGGGGEGDVGGGGAGAAPIASLTQREEERPRVTEALIRPAVRPKRWIARARREESEKARFNPRHLGV